MLPETVLLLALLGPQATTPDAPQTNKARSAQDYQPSSAATQTSGNKQYVPKPCAPDANGGYNSLDTGIAPPRAVHLVEPKFPKMAKRQKFLTVARVNLIVDASGKPQNVHIAGSAADKLDPSLRSLGLALDASAINAVEQYRFKPATCEAKPITVQLNVEVNFQIF
jgi:periplasmic protein TonB